MEIICIILAAVAGGAVCVALHYRSLLQTARRDAERRAEEYEKLSEATERRFAELADRALARNSETMRATGVNSINEALRPMRENIENFRRSIEERYSRESNERASLGQNMAQLMELSRSVGRETARLAAALKGGNSRAQGDWGEMMLDNILQKAGLRKGTDYDTQMSMNTDEGRRLRPDVVLHYGDGRHIMIDSKASIQDYLKMNDATDETERARYGMAHVASVRKHITELAEKRYQDMAGGTAFDYVLMFIPNEGAFLSALQLDASLWETAYRNNVLPVSPTHLLAVVKLVEQMQRHDKQNRNALAIADEAGKMLDKLRGFTDDMDRIGKALGAATNTWNEAYRKLSNGTGNLIGRAEKLRDLGAKVKN